MTQSLEQKRATHALATIQIEAALGKEKYGNYRSYSESLPASILMNVLGQALAMLLTKTKQEEKKRLYKVLSNWVGQHVFNNQNPDSLLENITKNPEQKYLEAHAEALAYLSWLKKFAAAYLEKQKGSD